MRTTFKSLLEQFELSKTLNPALFNLDTQQLKPEVRDRCLEIAKVFAEYVHIEQDWIQDVIFCGSNAQYNYTKNSDIDVHLIVHTGLFKSELTQEYFAAKKALWGSEHNITIYGYDVELYVQETDDLVALGVYSLTQDKWVRKPERVQVQVDDEYVQLKANDLKAQVDSLISDHADDITAFQDIKDKIAKMRADALMTGGEFSNDNLVFKELRNSGYLEKLKKYLRSAEDDSLSLR